MSTGLALRLATYVLVYDGLIALWLGGLLTTLALAAVGAAVAVSWWQDRLRERLRGSSGSMGILIVFAAGALTVDLLYLAVSYLDGLVHLLLFLLLYRLFMRRSLRDARDAGFLAFFMLVAAAPVSFGVGYLFVFLTFLVAGTWLLMLYHVAAESGRVSDRTAVTTLGRDLLRLSVLASAAILAVTAALFFVIPRVGQAALPFKAQAGRMVSGFSDRVELGAYGDIETDAAVVMRVRLPEGVSPAAFPDLRWRGIALDHFDGRAWSSGRPRWAIRRPSLPGQFELAAYRGRGQVLTQEVFLEPIGTDVLFGAARMLRAEVRAESLAVDDMGTVLVPSSSARLQYIVYSEVDRDAGARRPGRVERLDEPAQARFLQLPPVSDRLRALAREVVGTRAPAPAALALTTYLSREYRYTLSLERRSDLDPVEQFLFVSRAGNCEYFAAALAVMLRTVGIPARVVNGFQRGEWNPYGRYFMVRLRDAHSWVEAHVGGQWITLDASPRGEGPGVAAPSRLGLYLDALRVRWYRYVINWSLEDQAGAAMRAQQAARAWRAWLQLARTPADVPRVAVMAVALVAGGLLVAFWARGRTDLVSRAAGRPPRFYVRALRALARRGLRPGAGETAREFAARVRRALPGHEERLAALTAGYERVRFGGVALSPAEVSALEADAGRLRGRRVAMPPPSPR
jgi:transglutaminase-like putative cysteine protease